MEWTLDKKLKDRLFNKFRGNDLPQGNDGLGGSQAEQKKNEVFSQAVKMRGKNPLFPLKLQLTTCGGGYRATLAQNLPFGWLWTHRLNSTNE